MYILYADEAGNTGTDYDNKQQPIFSLSGIVVNTDKWNDLNSYILEKQRLIIPEFLDCELHATEIFNGKKCKNNTYNFRQFPLEKNLNILEQLVDLVVEINCPIITFIVRKENLKRYCRSNYGSSVKIDPYLIAFPYITLFFDELLINQGSNGLIFLDEQKPLVANIDSILDKLKLIDDFNFFDIKVTNVIERALFLDSSKSKFIQLADLCNFYINRYISMDYECIPKEPKATHIINMYKKIEPLIFKPNINPSELKNMLIFFDDNKEILNNHKK